MEDRFKQKLDSSITQHRPLLIQINENVECDMLDSENLKKFVQENYTVCSLNISNLVDRKNLAKIWQKYFPGQLPIDFSLGQCPMYIAVMKSFPIANNLFSEFFFQILNVNEEFTANDLLHELTVFKNEFEQNHQYFLSDFIRKIVSCPELILAISKYVSLNDAVATFSPAVLSFLWQHNRRLPVIDPTPEFFHAILRSNHLDKIMNLYLHETQANEVLNSNSMNIFGQLKQLPFNQHRIVIQIRLIDSYFSNLTSLTLFFDAKIDLLKLIRIFNKIPSSIRHFIVHCDSMRCSCCSLKILDTPTINSNITITNFALYLNHDSQSSVENCCIEYGECQLRMITELIAYMLNIEKLRIVMEENIQRLFGANEWIHLMVRCTRLNEIKFKGILSQIELREQFQNMINEIQNIPRAIHVDIQLLE